MFMMCQILCFKTVVLKGKLYFHDFKISKTLSFSTGKKKVCLIWYASGPCQKKNVQYER